MTSRAVTALLSLTALSAGCIVYEDPGPPAPGPGNYAPFVEWADAGCYWDGYYADHIWYFEADVTDPDGALDVVAVYADVYDSRGEWVDSFELFPTQDPVYWFSDWLGSSTWLDCGYRGYLVDIVAYDSFDAVDVLTITPAVAG
ncbi:hypothetical protein L6R53_24050 [Myxococcota bacterium]|nr:hypothetical protein [Myxococcota bacterium]